MEISVKLKEAVRFFRYIVARKLVLFMMHFVRSFAICVSLLCVEAQILRQQNNGIFLMAWVQSY